MRLLILIVACLASGLVFAQDTTRVTVFDTNYTTIFDTNITVVLDTNLVFDTTHVEVMDTTWVTDTVHFMIPDTPRIIIDETGMVNPWNHLSVNNAPENFQFAIVSDRTGGKRDGVFPIALNKLNLLQPELVMSVGDLIDGYTEDIDEIHRQWDEFDSFTDSLSMPFFYVPGNHDYINPQMAQVWEERLGPAFYHFLYQDVLFLCLNTEDSMRGAGQGYISDSQYDYVEAVLDSNAQARWTLIFMHQPLWDQADPGRWPDIEKKLADRQHTVFVGHRHRYVKYERNNGKYFILATTGGGSRLRGPGFGEFDHVVWVTMTDNGPIISNLMLDGIWDENIHTDNYFGFSKPLIERDAIRLGPIMAESAARDFPVFIRNRADVPLEVDLAFESSDELWLASYNQQFKIWPNSSERFFLPLKMEDNAEPAGLNPIQVNATLRYLPENQPTLEIHRQYRLAPEPLRRVDRSTKNVDGRIDDWGETLIYDLPRDFSEGDFFTTRGGADLDVNFDLALDATFLYVAVQVRDDKIEIDPKKSPYHQDGVWISIDPRPLKVSSQFRGPITHPDVLLFGISPQASSMGYGHVYKKDELPEGSQSYYRRTSDGYIIEAKFPMSWLAEKAGGNLNHLRINVSASDHDNDGIHVSRLHWQPQWDSKENRIGSGSFLLKD